MIRTYRRPATTLMLLTVASSACQDLPAGAITDGSALDLRRTGTSLPGLGLGRPGPSPYLCYVSERTEGGLQRYRYGILPLRFPRNAISPDGSTRSYRLHVKRPGEDPVGAARCVIPDTPEAVRMLNRRFGVEGGGQAEQTEGTALMSTTCTVSNCPIEGIVVTAPPKGGGSGTSDGSWYDNCDSAWSCNDGSPGDWYGGGDSYEPPPPETDDICTQREAGCLQELDAVQAAGIANTLSQVRTNIADPEVQRICTSLQSTAQRMLNEGLIMAGNREMPDGPQGEDHSAEYDPATGMMHVDEAFLDAAINGGYNQSLGAIILHEAAHRDGFYHPLEEKRPYTSFPFRHTSYTGYTRPGVEECM